MRQLLYCMRMAAKSKKVVLFAFLIFFMALSPQIVLALIVSKSLRPVSEFTEIVIVIASLVAAFVFFNFTLLEISRVIAAEKQTARTVFNINSLISSSSIFSFYLCEIGLVNKYIMPFFTGMLSQGGGHAVSLLLRVDSILMILLSLLLFVSTYIFLVTGIYIVLYGFKPSIMFAAIIRFIGFIVKNIGTIGIIVILSVVFAIAGYVFTAIVTYLADFIYATP